MRRKQARGKGRRASRARAGRRAAQATGAGAEEAGKYNEVGAGVTPCGAMKWALGRRLGSQASHWRANSTPPSAMRAQVLPCCCVLYLRGLREVLHPFLPEAQNNPHARQRHSQFGSKAIVLAYSYKLVDSVLTHIHFQFYFFLLSNPSCKIAKFVILSMR